MKRTKMKPENNIRIFESDELAKAAAEYLIEIANEAIHARCRFAISLSGGHTPEKLFALLASDPYRTRMAWDKTYVFWGDERCVPSNDEQNNARMAKIFLLDKVDIPTSNIFPIPVDQEPEIAAIVYENSIKDFFGNQPPRFDLILLGLGENGHTASLFPGTDVLSEHAHLVKEVYVAEQKMYRITMTADLINQALNIIFLVEGEGKADILKTVLAGCYEPERLPAQLINPVAGKLVWVVDNKAAARLE